MPLPYFPRPGEVLICAFDDAAIGAEMVKRRPAVVVSRHNASGSRLATVVPLSTTAPNPTLPWHHPLPHLRITGWPSDAVSWAKCDMLATVSLDRLNKPYIKTRQGRSYTSHVLSDVDMQAIRQAIRAHLAL